MDYISVYINKPLYASFVYVRDKYIKEAKNKNCRLKISCPTETCLVTADEWLKDAKMIEKEFLIPGHPMKLYGNLISRFNEGNGESAT